MIHNVLMTNYKRFFLLLIFTIPTILNGVHAKGSGNGTKSLLIEEMEKITEEMDSAIKAGVVERNGEKVRVVISSDQLFSNNHVDLVSNSILLKLAKVIKAHELIKVQIDGHTDSMGAGTYNQKLSEGRAESVLNYFVNQGIDEDRLVAKGFGETSPAANNLTKENRAKNRRIELTFSPSKKMIKLAEKGKLGK